MADLRTFGVVLFKGFELLDVFGPLEAWGMLAATGQCKVTTVAERSGAVTSAQGPKVIADYGFGDCPHLDLILIPGGIGTREEISNQLLLDWLKARAKEAEVVTTVCTGTAILARTGLLDGRRATTNKRAFKARKSTGFARRGGSRTGNSRPRPGCRPESTWRWPLWRVYTARKQRSRSRSRWSTNGIAMPDGILSRKFTAWSDRRRDYFAERNLTA
jgi:putative intracellular protease/amidase